MDYNFKINYYKEKIQKIKDKLDYDYILDSSSINTTALAIETWQNIIDYTDFLGQIRLRQCCKCFYSKLHIYDFYYAD